MRANFFKRDTADRKSKKESALSGFISRVKRLRVSSDLKNEIRLSDGRLIVYDFLKTGGVVMLKDDILPVPLWQGVYELIDKSRVYVGNGGVILTVTPPKK